ncbi:MAG TPA: ferredoxin [Jatrophihabitans sp.]|jgi:ferredoxin|uniref:ferredoxin n=1 Tax=Jatrophihabitans sp. TaxID=1932789 RepID=UPI002E00FB50|nr:ferredoxin [Jatrophihabitans sp.]
MRIRVNPITCEAHGLCAEMLPEWIQLDEWGYPILDGPELPEQLAAHARRAAAACPTLAVLLTKE